ncbi:MAG: hypothetical protein AAFR66_14535, partial [Bacteroidota bacterium]
FSFFSSFLFSVFFVKAICHVNVELISYLVGNKVKTKILSPSKIKGTKILPPFQNDVMGGDD